METKKISKRFENIEVIPGNGYSPYTGCLVFRCYDSYLGTSVTVKSSDGIKNIHKTVKEEYEFIKGIKHPGVIEVLDYYEEGNAQYMVMKGQYGGGRRNRWREIFMTFDESTTTMFLELFMQTLFYLQEQGVLHEDIECANMVYNDVTIEPILIDFGRASHKKYSKGWLIDQLRLGRITKQNAFFREITNSGGVYVTEPPHFNFDVKPIIGEILRND